MVQCAVVVTYFSLVIAIDILINLPCVNLPAYWLIINSQKIYMEWFIRNTVTVMFRAEIKYHGEGPIYETNLQR